MLCAEKHIYLSMHILRSAFTFSDAVRRPLPNLPRGSMQNRGYRLRGNSVFSEITRKIHREFIAPCFHGALWDVSKEEKIANLHTHECASPLVLRHRKLVQKGT